MKENTETFVENVMETAQQSSRKDSLFPLLRSRWSELGAEDDAYFSIKESYDCIYLKLALNDDYQKEVGELKFLTEVGTIKLTGNESESIFLVIKYPSDSRRYYVSFVVECCSILTSKHNIEDMEKILFKWIKRWKLKGGSRREKRIGVFGELLCLEYLLTKIENVEWKCWQEGISDSGLHDFIVNSKILEVKNKK